MMSNFGPRDGAAAGSQAEASSLFSQPPTSAVSAEKGAGRSVLSVSGAMALAKGALEGVTVSLVGEVSEVSNKPGYKAVYFTVKDASASLPCMMWNNRYRSAGVELRVGMLVELSGRFTLYAAKGRMNFDVFSVSLAGEGNLRLQVANLARKLQAEGLMDPARKRPLPYLPQTIGIVTSPRGAAVHDMLRTLRRRYPVARVVVAGVPVEGANAPRALIEGLRAVVAAGAEVVLLGRGGGSFEDLMPFNDERLARTVAACPIPVVTGIGHEPDNSIADMVADFRASTPTGAAEAVVPDRSALVAQLDARLAALCASVSARVERERQRLAACASRPVFQDAHMLFSEEALTVDLASDRIRRAAAMATERWAVPLEHAAERLHAALPRSLERDRATLGRMEDRLKGVARTLLTPFENQVALSAARLRDLSPLTILSRGYSVTKDANGSILKSVERVSAGDAVSVLLDDGELACRVEDVAPHPARTAPDAHDEQSTAPKERRV